jgi:hypothetical protein
LNQASINIIVTVDWEGRDLHNDNLKKMELFREENKDIPILHFLNAAYFTKPGIREQETKEKIYSVLRPGDEHGLHIHSWKSLLEKSGVTFKTFPSWAQNTPLSNPEDGSDIGQCVPISAYTTKEITKMIETSREILIRNDFRGPTSFRAGGWMATEKVREALIETGISIDSSALPISLLKGKRKNNLLLEMLNDVWKKIEITDRPYIISKNSQKNALIELPNNGCLADYMTGEETLGVYKDMVKVFEKNPTQDVYLTTGFHQETANKFLDRLREGLDLIREESLKNGIPTIFPKLPLNLTSF